MGSRWIGRSAGDVINGGETASSLTSPDGMADSPSKKLFFRARKVNAATKTMPTPVIQTALGKVFHVPIRMVISAANPLNPGMPIDAAEAITKTKAAKESARLSSNSDNSSRSRV